MVRTVTSREVWSSREAFIFSGKKVCRGITSIILGEAKEGIGYKIKRQTQGGLHDSESGGDRWGDGGWRRREDGRVEAKAANIKRGLVESRGKQDKAMDFTSLVSLSVVELTLHNIF